MPSIKIEGVPPYDGEYELDMNFTNRDLHTIKQVAGVRAGDLNDALEHKDLDLVVALAVNALRRAGKPIDMDVLWDSEAGRILLVADEDAVPPPQPSDESSGSVSEPTGSSGTSGPVTGDASQGNDPSSTGSQDSASQ
jgi:hypothetical protein